MTSDAIKRLIELLHATLHEVAQASDLPAGDPAFLRLKSIMLNRIAELEAEMSKESAALMAQSTADSQA